MKKALLDVKGAAGGKRGQGHSCTFPAPSAPLNHHRLMDLTSTGLGGMFYVLMGREFMRESDATAVAGASPGRSALNLGTMHVKATQQSELCGRLTGIIMILIFGMAYRFGCDALNAIGPVNGTGRHTLFLCTRGAASTDALLPFLAVRALTLLLRPSKRLAWVALSKKKQRFFAMHSSSLWNCLRKGTAK